MSLYRLIRLAKKTGDRLIVHNETDSSNIVIMDLDNYERLVDFVDPEDFGVDFGSVPPWSPTPDPWDMTPSTTTQYPWEAEDEPEYGSDDWFRQQRDRMQQDDWTSIGDLMGERYPDLCEDIDEEDEVKATLEDDIPPFGPQDEEEIPDLEPEIPTEPTVEPIHEPTVPHDPSQGEGMIVLAEEPVLDAPVAPIADISSVPAPAGVATPEESLSSDPVFYEEPT